MRRRAKVDQNQPEIVAHLRSLGAGVIHCHQLKNAFDILVCFRGQTYIVEIKMPKKERLTEGEGKCRDLVESKGVKYNVITSKEEAQKMLGL